MSRDGDDGVKHFDIIQAVTKTSDQTNKCL